VTCAVDAGAAGAEVAARASARVSLSGKNAPVEDVLGRLATSAGYEGVDYRATRHPTVNVNLEGVRAATAMAVLADETGLKITAIGTKLVAAD
jgi:hypothetical protein